MDAKRRRIDKQTPKKDKSTPPAYKIRSYLGQRVNMEVVLDEFILQKNIQMSLGTFLGVATKEVQENLMDRV